MSNSTFSSVIQSNASATSRVTPSRVDSSRPFTLDQELELFGNWVADPIWVPPKDASRAMAQTMVDKSTWFQSEEERWEVVVQEHRRHFTQVREIELTKASIRLPKGRFFVSVTEQENFDQITEKIPACVQTRLEEFLDGPGKQKGVKVYYLKPLCVEADDRLILTAREDVAAAIEKIQNEVFEEYEDLYYSQLPRQLATGFVDLSLAIPRRIINYFVERRQRQIDAFEARLEFQRRKTAMRAAKAYRRSRSGSCTFGDMLELTRPLERTEVVDLYGVDQELSLARKRMLKMIASGQLPWFIGLSLGGSAAVVASVVAPLFLCDPAFVAEMPDAPGQLLKIGHFDEIAGVTHVEI